MATDEERAALIVVLATLFGRNDDVSTFPASVHDLRTAVVADARWASAAALTDRALVVAAVLAADPVLSARVEADAAAGLIGMGAGDDPATDAAIGAVEKQLAASAPTPAPPPLPKSPMSTRPHTGPKPSSAKPSNTAPPKSTPPQPKPPGVPPPVPPSASVPAPNPSPPSASVPSPPQEPLDSTPPSASVPPIDLPPALAPATTDSLDLPTPTVDEPGDADGSAGDDGGPAEAAGGDGAFEAGDASGGGAADVPAAPDLPAAQVTTWLNADLDDGGAPVETGKTYPLAVFFADAPAADADAAAKTVIGFLQGVSTIDLDVQLASNDFAVPAQPQTLTVSRQGVSVGRVTFEVTPLHDGPSTLSVVVTVAGNFLQRLDLTLDVGGAPGAATQAFGRPLGAATVLQPRQAVLEFTPAAGGYQLRAAQVFPDRFLDVLVTPDELAARIAGVRKALYDAVTKPSVGLHLDLQGGDRDALLAALAQAGIRLFQTIFRGPDASDELRQVGTWLETSLADDVTTLQVVSTGFPVPWALMYPADRLDPAALSWDGFIGMRHVVEQVRMVKQNAAPPPVQIASTPQLTVRALFNDTIDTTMASKPVAGQRTYWNGRGVALTLGTTVDDLETAALAPTATDQVLYLFCHAKSSGTDPDASELILTGNNAVTLGELSTRAPTQDRLAAQPLVFLNACESGEMSPNFYDGFVAYFTAKGARGVIGTECLTPGLFAAEWAKAFFDELFAGRSLGETVLTLRRRFLADHQNPLGLLYGVHADPDTVVTPALAPSSPSP